MELNSLLKDRRMLLLFAVLALVLLLVSMRGIHFGLEFVGGTRIPVTLERSVDQITMDEITSTIKSRVSAFGLQQVLVKAIGESEIYIDLPQSDSSLVTNTMALLEKQGRFEGIVDGKVAVDDQVIMPSSIAAQTATSSGGWTVDFAIDEAGAIRFAEVVKGKGNYPVYMFLDRPGDSIILLTPTELVGESTLTESEALAAVTEVLRKENNTIPLFIVSNWTETKAQIQNINATTFPKAIVSNSTNASILTDLAEMGFEVVLKNESEIIPSYSNNQQRSGVDTWRAIGLLSSPVLNADLAQGQVNRFYAISGYAPSNLPQAQKVAYATAEAKDLKSILSGGALPVHIIVGTPTTIPSPLGAEFLKYSLITIVAVVLLMVLIISIRYKMAAIAPLILITSLSEVIILVCIIGSLGTIDLSAMAGIIGAIGTGVDAQIVITDEILAQSKSGATLKRKLGNAFYIIFTNATIAVIAMIPLLFFSGLVEIIGFALSTIFGMFIGALITRPAYGAMVEHVLGHKDEQ